MFDQLEFRALLAQDGTYDNYYKMRKGMHFGTCTEQDLLKHFNDLTQDKDKDYDGMLALYHCRCMYDLEYGRKKRLKQRIKDMLIQGDCLFLTLTFNDETLNNSSVETRRTYVRKYLKEHFNQYVANIDFGSEKEREHYHAVVQGDYADLKWWKHGFSYVEKVRQNRKAPICLAKYITKLTNHAFKDTTTRMNYIYSRNH